MAQTIDMQAIANEIVRYGTRNPKALETAILSKDVHLNKFATPVGKVKGKWTIPQLFMGHVVQIFHDEWNPYGDLKARVQEVENFHQKVNFGFKPYSVYGTWMEDLYHEEKKVNEMPISKYVVDKLLKPKIIDDLNILSVSGVYDPSQKNVPDPNFGTSMDGLNTRIDKRIANGNTFTIPVDAADTIVDQITEFERALPQHAKIKGIFISLKDFNDYVELREKPNDSFQDYTDPHLAKTKYGRPIYAIPGLTEGRIVAWAPDNLIRLYDRKTDPAKIDDVQVQDYEVKIFSQWHLGYDIAYSEFLYVSSVDGAAVRGLGDDTLNKLIYPGEYGLTTATP